MNTWLNCLIQLKINNFKRLRFIVKVNNTNLFALTDEFNIPKIATL